MKIWQWLAIGVVISACASVIGDATGYQFDAGWIGACLTMTLARFVPRLA